MYAPSSNIEAMQPDPPDWAISTSPEHVVSDPSYMTYPTSPSTQRSAAFKEEATEEEGEEEEEEDDEDEGEEEEAGEEGEKDEEEEAGREPQAPAPSSSNKYVSLYWLVTPLTVLQSAFE